MARRQSCIENEHQRRWIAADSGDEFVMNSWRYMVWDPIKSNQSDDNGVSLLATIVYGVVVLMWVCYEYSTES